MLRSIPVGHTVLQGLGRIAEFVLRSGSLKGILAKLGCMHLHLLSGLRHSTTCQSADRECSCPYLQKYPQVLVEIHDARESSWATGPLSEPNYRESFPL